ncbi:MAG: hypothetical protein AB7G23_09555 [Vicinamibacterales bacterium]
MADILIAGALDFSREDARTFITHLGEEVIAQGHNLLNGCRNEFDRAIAQAAHAAATSRGIDPERRITSYVVAHADPAHTLGKVLRSRLAGWGLEFESLHVPEPVHEAEAVVVVGGKDGTLCAANWARIDNKPLLPVTAFGGAALTAYTEELKDFDAKYGGRLDRAQYEALNQVPSDLAKLARDVVALAARVQASRFVFAIMSFSDDPRMQDAYESFTEVCEEFEYECARVDNTTASGRIVPQILESIHRAAFVIADLSEQRPNVYYELGLAQGMKKPYIVTAAKGTLLPFDVHDVPTIFWENQKQLKDGLRRKVREIATSQGR